MRAFTCLVVFTASFILAVSSATARSHPIGAVLVSSKSNQQRFLRSHNTAHSDNEERATKDAVTKLSTRFSQLKSKLQASKLWESMKSLTDKELRAERLYLSGASHAKLYENKVDPDLIYRRLDIHTIAKWYNYDLVALMGDPKYSKWARYFDYWVDRNSGKIAK
ncbi:unnamed protein product [Phytophthora fragariaefolia]|uniref:RxLR effector protein n=1 Tax=Phytophthora fragariaefolia TaxID=1490495 RepID=A0A9W6XLD3_9STRA|nr:unnamed protein product [Phytophthora fragariaefolia]